MLTLKINLRKQLIKEDESAALIKKEVPTEYDAHPSSLSFMAEPVWAAVQGLKQVKVFESLSHSMEQEALQWKKWYGEEKAEFADLPKSMKDCSSFHRLLLLRAMRPDRLQGALRQYVIESLGEEFIEQPAFQMENVYDVMTVGVPIFFVLFPGVDPTPDVERVGRMYGKSSDAQSFINISMG
jgi:dynein heavy chain, axonemal